MKIFPHRPPSDRRFVVPALLLAAFGLLFPLLLPLADLQFAVSSGAWSVLQKSEIHYALILTILSASISSFLALLTALPAAFVLERFRFPGRGLLNFLPDLPLIMPPMLVGLCLLLLFNSPWGRVFEQYFRFSYAVPGVILAQYIVVFAFALRNIQAALANLDTGPEEMAMTLGCNRRQAFSRVTLPVMRRELWNTAALCWAKAAGEFGPILIFCGTVRFRTEVLSVSVFLELSSGNAGGAAVISLLLIFIAGLVSLLVRQNSK